MGRVTRTVIGRNQRERMKRVYRKHATKRAAQRFGLNLTVEDHAEICRKIRENSTATARCLERLTTSRSLWLVLHGEQWLPVVYSRSMRCIVTVLPEKAVAAR